MNEPVRFQFAKPHICLRCGEETYVILAEKVEQTGMCESCWKKYHTFAENPISTPYVLRWPRND